MQQFVAILKDSFREAVDGFVIYVMLGLALVMVVLIGSVSYEPEPPDEALPEVLNQFNFVFPDRGASKSPSALPAFLDYKATDTAAAADGTVTFTLKVEENLKGMGLPDADGAKAGDPPKRRPSVGAFRFAVATWKLPAGEKMKEDPRRARNRMLNQPEKKLDIVLPPNMTPADLAGVTADDMDAFLRSQCVLSIGVPEAAVTVQRKPPADDAEYAFDVTLRSVSGARGWPHKIFVLFKAFPPIRKVPLGMGLYVIQDQLVNGLGAGVALLISVVITGFFIPNMLRKGSFDLLVSKPIGRVQLLVYKYIGGLTFMFLISAFTIGGVWLVMSLRSGYWNPGFLLVVPALTFTFAVVYAVSTLVAVLTRSAIAAIMLSVGFIVVMWIIGQVKSFFDRMKLSSDQDVPEWAYTLVDTVNNVLPRYKDLDKLTTKAIVDANLPDGLARMLGVLVEFPSFGGAVGVSLAFIVLMLALASWRLAKRDG